MLVTLHAKQRLGKICALILSRSWRYTYDNSDVILSLITTAAMLNVYYVAAA